MDAVEHKVKYKTPRGWLNATVLGIGLASLLSDWSHETATAVLPAFLASVGAAAAWVGLIEGAADGLSSFAKLASGHWTDRLARRKPVMVAGYAVTTLATASFGLATAAWQILVARSTAWLGRGVRTPVRKAMLAAAVTRETYGRAFGFERMMDTLGAIVGPLSAILLFKILSGNFSAVFLCTLVPGLGAVCAVAFLVRERARPKVKAISFRESLRELPPRYRRFLLAVGFFGLGDCAHTLLILLATQKLAPVYGAPAAATIAMFFYVLHNVLYAAFAFVAGWLADRIAKAHLLGCSYTLAALMALIIVVLPMNVPTLTLVFVLGGVHVGMTETAEDSLCAELVDESRHGTAFGVLATVNGVGDFLSSVVVGALWTAAGVQTAFGYCLGLFLLGAVLVWRVGGRTMAAK
ncbi:MAG TPA: MFS transporter [Opitutales bacterium]|nr:MFS transporter [Opitutales bacterium]